MGEIVYLAEYRAAPRPGEMPQFGGPERGFSAAIWGFKLQHIDAMLPIMRAKFKDVPVNMRDQLMMWPPHRITAIFNRLRTAKSLKQALGSGQD